MRIVRCIASAGIFAFKVGALVVGMAWLAAIPQAYRDRRGDAPAAATSALAAGPAADTIEVRMRPAEGRPYAFYSLQDEAGKELARVTYSLRGLVVHLGEAFPARPGFSARADGSCDFVVAHGKIHYQFKLRPNGTSGLLILDDQQGDVDGLGVDRDGRLVRGPLPFD
jgi:hypothetical protein